MFSFQPKIMRQTKNQETVTDTQGRKKKALKTAFEEAQMVDLVAKNFKASIKNIVKKLNETMA